MAASGHLQVFVLLQAMDLASTVVGVRFGAQEANPGALGLLGWGWPALLAVKLLFLAGVVALLFLHGGPAWSTLVHGLNILYGAVVAWNLALLASASPWWSAACGAALVAMLPLMTPWVTKRPVPQSVRRPPQG